MGSGIKGFKSQKILKSKINGYSFDDSVDPERYATIQELTGDKHGLDVVNHGAFKVNLAAKTVEAGSNVRVIKNTAHGAIKGDQIRFITDGIEASVLSIPDANTIILGSELNFDPTGLTFDILRHITPTYNSDGTINVSSGPLQIKVDGLATDVNVDTVTPSNTVRLPVEVYSAAGPINITAGDINVQLSDTGATPDITRIGNGTNRLDINANKEALVHDTDALAQLSAINTNTDAIETKLDTVATKLTDGTQLTKITDGAGTVTTKQLGTAVTNTDVGLVTNTVIHGLSSGGGGTYVDVKVTPSGALVADVTATNLDIRDLAFATDKVDVSGSSVTVSGTVTVSATNLDIRDLAFATDKVDVSGSSVTVSGTATVSATDLDIRNLSFAQDTVDVSGSSVSISNTVAVAQGSVGANFYENNSLSGAVNALSGATVKKVYIQADSDNTDAIRFKLTTTGAAASSTSGWKLLPGADIALELGGGSLNTTLSICPVSGTQKVVVQYA